MSSKKHDSFLKCSLKDYIVGEESNLHSVTLGTGPRQVGESTMVTYLGSV